MISVSLFNSLDGIKDSSDDNLDGKSDGKSDVNLDGKSYCKLDGDLDGNSYENSDVKLDNFQKMAWYSYSYSFFLSFS